MTDPTIRLGVPRVVARTLERPSLLARLDAREPLTVVRGIAGSGKSSLVASWLIGRERSGDVLWVSRTADVVTRSEYWTDVLRELDRFEDLAAWTDDLLDAASVEEVLRTAFSAIDRPFTLVLDNFGPPGDAWDEICDDVLAVLREAPALRIIVIGREPTRLERDVRGVVEIGTDDLRFTADETRRLAELVGVGDLAEVDVEALLGSSRGIVFPLRYALEAAVRARRADRPAGDWAARLAGEMLERLQDPGVIDAAGALAQAPYATVDLVVDLLGIGQEAAREVIRRLARPGLATLDDEGTLRFTESARIALRDAYRAANPGRSAAADVLIARWFRERGDGGAGIAHAIRGGDFDLAADLLVEHFVDLGEPEIGELVDALDRLGDRERASYPTMTMLSSLLRAAIFPRRAATAELFATVVEMSKARKHAGSSPRERFILSAGEAIAERGLGHSAGALAAARDVLRADWEMSHGERASLGTARPLFLGQTGLAALYSGAGDVAYACLGAELAASPRDAFPRRRNVALANLAMLSVLGGRARAAAGFLAEIVDEDWAAEVRDPRPSTSYTIAAAYLALNRGDFAATSRILDEQSDGVTPATDNWAFVAVARAISRTLSGATRSAEVELVAALAAHDSPADGVAARVAGIETTIELLQLVNEDAVLGPQREIELAGRGAVILLATRAIRAVVGGRLHAAAELLVRARRSGSSPLQELYTAIASVILARAAGEKEPEYAAQLAPSATRIASVVTRHDFAWPLAMLTVDARAEVLAELAGRPDAEAVRAAFDRIPPVVRIAPRVVELHPREYAVLQGLVETGSRAELAARSFVSVNTIKTQLRSIYAKLGVGDRESALRRAAELGLLESRPAP